MNPSLATRCWANGKDTGDARLLRTATAFHEAGHAVMALVCGRPVHKVSIAPGKMQVGGYRLGRCDLKKGRTRASKDALEDEILILLAGMVAESMISGNYCEQSAASDLLAARKLISGRASSPRQAERLERRLLDKTEHLLSDAGNALAVRRIAQELVEKTEISGRAVLHFYTQAVESER